MAEIVEVVEHEVHVLLLLALQMVDDSLIFVHLDSDVCVSLAGNGSRFDKTSCLLVHVVATMGGRIIGSLVGVQSLLSPAHGLVVEFTALFLKLVIAHVKGVSSEAVVAHPHLILLSI